MFAGFLRLAYARCIARIVQRALLGTVGAYMLAASLVALLSVLFPKVLGMSRGDAAMLSAMLGFPLLLCLTLWALCCRSQVRIFIVISVGTFGSFTLMKLIAT